MNDIEQKTFDLAQEISKDIGLSIEKVEFVKEHSNFILRILVDKEEGVNVDDCTRLSEGVSLKLDELDFIEQEYFLEVSSLGAERELETTKDIEKSIGKYVHLKLYQKKDNQKEFEGYLRSFDGENLTIEVSKGNKKINILIKKAEISKIRLAIKF